MVTDTGLAKLRGLPLTALFMPGCDRIPDSGLEHLKGMPLTSLQLGECAQLTEEGIEHLTNLPLTALKFPNYRYHLHPWFGLERRLDWLEGLIGAWDAMHPSL